MEVTILKAGAKITSTAFPGCMVIAAPSGPAGGSGPYDDVSAFSLSNANFPVAGTGCTASSPATMTGSYKVTPNGGGNLEDVS